MLTSEVAVVKSHHGISVKCSRYRNTGTTVPSLGKIKRKLYAANIKLNNSVGIFINISFKDRLLINITFQNSVGDFNQKAVCTSITKHV